MAKDATSVLLSDRILLSVIHGVSLDVCKSVVIKPLHSYQLAVLALRNLTQGVRPLYNTYKLYTSEKLAAPIRATKTNGLVNHEDLILQSTSSKATKPFTQRLLSPKSILAFGCCHGLARQSNPKLLSASQWPLKGKQSGLKQNNTLVKLIAWCVCDSITAE